MLNTRSNEEDWVRYYPPTLPKLWWMRSIVDEKWWSIFGRHWPSLSLLIHCLPRSCLRQRSTVCHSAFTF